MEVAGARHPVKRKAVLELTESQRQCLGAVMRQARQNMSLTANEVATKALGLVTAHASVCRFERGVLDRIPVDRLKKLLIFYVLDYDQTLAQCQEH